MAAFFHEDSVTGECGASATQKEVTSITLS
jgi:hypothetical protein